MTTHSSTSKVTITVAPKPKQYTWWELLLRAIFGIK